MHIFVQWISYAPLSYTFYYSICEQMRYHWIGFLFYIHIMFKLSIEALAVLEMHKLPALLQLHSQDFKKKLKLIAERRVGPDPYTQIH